MNKGLALIVLAVTVLAAVIIGSTYSSSEPRQSEKDPRPAETRFAQREATYRAEQSSAAGQTPTAGSGANPNSLNLQGTLMNCIAIPGAKRIDPPGISYQLADGRTLAVSADEQRIYLKNESAGTERTVDRTAPRNRWTAIGGDERIVYCADSSGRVYIAPQPQS
jgi:hypothetical protein